MNQNRFNKYSIIIPSFNRADEIKEMVRSIQNLRYDRNKFEVLIVDDGSTDNTIEFLKKYQEEANYTLTCCSQNNQGPGAARNKGMQEADGDFFIFIDSDCTVPEFWLSEINTALNNNKADAFGGPDTYRDEFPAILKAINYSMTSFITTGGLRGKKGKKLAKFYPRSFNMGISRQIINRIGGFGSLRHGQDIEFSNRIIKSGAKIVFVANAPVYHKRRTNIRRFYKQVFNWGVARINLYTIDHSMIEPLHAMPAIITLFTLLIGLLAIFIQPVRTIFWIGCVLFGFILVFSMLDSIRLYKDVRPALFLPLIMPAQIFGYGFGFIHNFVRRVILKKKEIAGFKKSYYK
ncbi:MAG: glycosyltransferase [Calditrichia bacterium]|nr:glycosyltransferase [Calditrichia bacterium]